MRNIQNIFLAALLMLSGKGFSEGASISPKDALQKATHGEAILVDVREESEILESGMAAPAEWLATSVIDARGPGYEAAIKRWSKTTPIIFYCRSGRRSGIATTKFEKLGFNTMNMGAFEGWVSAGLPTKAKP